MNRNDRSQNRRVAPAPAPTHCNVMTLNVHGMSQLPPAAPSDGSMQCCIGSSPMSCIMFLYIKETSKIADGIFLGYYPKSFGFGKSNKVSTKIELNNGKILSIELYYGDVLKNILNYMGRYIEYIAIC